MNLDSECELVPGGPVGDPTNGCAVGSDQELWLKSDLAANMDKNVIALWHKPRFSSGQTNYTPVQPFVDDLYAAGADLVLVGHDHVYERQQPLDPSGNADSTYGISYFTIGTGGESHHSAGTLRPTSQVFNNDTYGIMKFTLHANSYDWQFFPEAGKTFTDSGTRSVHDGPDTNNAPVLDPIGNQNAQVGTQLAFTATASDADNDPLTFSLDDGTSGQVPAGASITSGGDFTWTPTSGQLGTATFDVCVTDSIAAPVCETTSFTVSTGSTPTITSFTPTSGPAGTLVTILGTNFTSSAAVKFNGATGTGFIFKSATKVKAKVPTGATTGPISVTTTAGIGTSTTNFTVPSGGSTPTITSFTPTSGPAGTLVTILGTNFTSSATVEFNGATGTGFIFKSATKVKAKVPTGATTGPISVTTTAGIGTSTTNFTVPSGGSTPTITSFTPTSGPAGTLVTIIGTNFTGATVVKFNGVIATSFTVNSDTTITATVPAGATTGKIIVKTPAGKATSLTKFTVT